MSWIEWVGLSAFTVGLRLCFTLFRHRIFDDPPRSCRHTLVGVQTAEHRGRFLPGPGAESPSDSDA